MFRETGPERSSSRQVRRTPPRVISALNRTQSADDDVLSERFSNLSSLSIIICCGYFYIIGLHAGVDNVGGLDVFSYCWGRFYHMFSFVSLYGAIICYNLGARSSGYMLLHNEILCAL